MSKVRLYIAGNEVDFGEGDNLLLFTYSAADLDAPAVVQNSYSKEITLPPTKRNAAVFGALWRPDKVASGADGFDALAREPFEIRNHAGELLESGYVKLSSASARDGYTLVLYGGLGAFLYGLMYNSDGSKKTLADLSWGDTLDAGLSFNITKDIVQAAWTRLQNNSDPYLITSAYDIINFAPMHNGIPSDFDSNKGLVPTGTAHGCHTYSGQTGVTIDGTNYALVTFGKQFDEWEVRDLRSYLQRPVFHISALLKALQNSDNNGGYTFDFSAVSSLSALGAWMTLPMLHTEEITEGNTTLTMTWNASGMSETEWKEGKVFAATFAETQVANNKADISVGLRLTINHNGFSYTPTLGSQYAEDSDYLHIFARLIGYDSGNNPVAYGPVRCLCSQGSFGANAVQYLQGMTQTADGYYQSAKFGVINKSKIEVQYQNSLTKISNAQCRTDTMGLTLSGYGIDHLSLVVQACYAKWHFSSSSGSAIPKKYYTWYETLNVIGPTRYYTGNTRNYTSQITNAYRSDTYASAAMENSNRVRTGAYISKKGLLGGTTSPAELLLSLIKVFGLVLAYDGLNKKVRLLNRGDFYAGDEVDISERIDRSQPYVVEPNGIQEKWLRFALGDAEGNFAEYYRNKYGVEYGEMRADTGSPFNAGVLGVLEGVKFVEGVTGLAYSRYFYIVSDSHIGSGILPAPYLDNDCKYTLWDSSGVATDHDVPHLTNSTNLLSICSIPVASRNGYDFSLTLQLAGKDNAQAQDGAGVLLWYNGVGATYMHHLTDDSAGMLNKNNGSPCWIPCLNAGSGTPLYIPMFTSINIASLEVVNSLNIAKPQELNGWNFYWQDGADIYSKRWRAYIADRYNENAHRVTCYVDWGGIRVEQALLGKFFWFDGCWWVLDKIEDYCWDNPQPCKCTFVRVLDKTAYTNGQS